MEFSEGLKKKVEQSIKLLQSINLKKKQYD